MFLPDANQAAGEVEEVAALRRVVPRRPADLGVLTVRVVIAALRSAQFVAAADHRHADRQHQRGHDVPALPIAQLQDPPVRGRSLHAAVPAEIVVLAVRIPFTVGFVVLLVVAHEVGEREPVVSRDEVDARVRTPAALFIQIAAAGQSGCQLGDTGAVAAPEPSHGIAVLPVPFGPLRGKVTDLVPAFAQIPRFGDQLHLRQHGILVNDVEECSKLVDGMQLTSQRAREIEAEPVDVHLDDPVPQAVHDELQHAWIPHVQRVATTGEVLIEARLIRLEPVVRRVVDAAQRQRRSLVIAFRAMVVDHVENHFEVRGVQRAHHHLELAHRILRRRRRRVLNLRRKVRQRVVSPVVREISLCEMPVVQVVMRRHQFHRGDAEPREMPDGRFGGESQVRAAQRFRDVRVQLRESLDVKFVDERLVPGRPQRPIVPPRERAVDDRRERREWRAVAVVERRVFLAELEAEQRLVPSHGSPDHLGVGIQDEFVRVESIAHVGCERAVHPIAVELAGEDVREVPVPHHIGVFGQRNRDGLNFGLRRVEQAQFDACCVFRKHGEVDADTVPCGAQRIRSAGPDAHFRSRHRRS